MRTDLVVINFGGPRSADEVEPFLFSLFDDPDVIQLSLGPKMQSAFAKLIASRRAPSIVPRYEQIGFSPLTATTLEQVKLLREKLGDRVRRVHVAMRYTRPSIEELVENLTSDPPERIVALALYPHYSVTTTGSSFNALAHALYASQLGRIPIAYIPAFYEQPSYVKAMASRIRDAAHGHLLFSAHGIPSSYSRDGGDPYPDQIRESVRLIVKELGGPAHSLAFQSRVGPVRWLGPSTEEEIMRLAKSGVKEATVIPISFTTEGIETLYDIDIGFTELAKSHGLVLHRARTVDTHPDFIDCLADVASRAIEDQTHQGLGAHRCVRCLLPKPHDHRTRVVCPDCNHRTPYYLLALPPVR